MITFVTCRDGKEGRQIEEHIFQVLSVLQERSSRAKQKSWKVKEPFWTTRSQSWKNQSLIIELSLFVLYSSITCSSWREEWREGGDDGSSDLWFGLSRAAWFFGSPLCFFWTEIKQVRQWEIGRHTWTKRERHHESREDESLFHWYCIRPKKCSGFTYLVLIALHSYLINQIDLKYLLII